MHATLDAYPFATALDTKYAVAANKNDVKIFISLFAEE
jgi:hypothetical protein